MPGILTLFALAALVIVAVGAAGIVYRMTHPPRLTYGVAVARRFPLCPTDLGLDFEERTLRLSDNIETPAWIIRGRDPLGPTIVVTHGWGDSRYGAQMWAALFADFASRLVVYDLRGQGESPAKASRLGTREIDDLIAIVRQVSGDADASQPSVVLFGASMGAGISIAAAAREPSLVRGVIGDGAYRRGMEPLVGFFRMNNWPLLPFYHLVGAWLSFFYIRDRLFDRASHAARLRCPLLLLHGANDPICPLAAARALAEAAPDATLVIFENGQHLDLAEVDRDRYLDALRTFFRRLRDTAPRAAPADAAALTDTPQPKRNDSA